MNITQSIKIREIQLARIGHLQILTPLRQLSDRRRREFVSKPVAPTNSRHQSEHSILRTFKGSTRDALHAGRAQAISATSSKMIETIPIMLRSRGLVSYRID